MRDLNRFICLISLGAFVATGCGDGGDNGAVSCGGSVCPCTEGGIRGAIAEGGGPFTFDCAGPTTVVTSAEIVIDNDVTLDGGGNLTVDGDLTHRVFSVAAGVTANLIGFTVLNGFTVVGGDQTLEHGGGIRNAGTLTLESSTVSGSAAGDDTGCRTNDLDLRCSEGGGIWNAGTLTIVNSSISGNFGQFGGGIANRQGSLTLVESTVSANTAQGCVAPGGSLCSGGGGIWNGATLTMQESAVSGNTSDWGSGVYNRGGTTLTESTLSGNTAALDGGGILSFETVTLTNCTVADNTAGQSGGGIANAGGVLNAVSSTLSANTAVAGGGGIINRSGASADFLNVTVSGNSAETGGGIYNIGGLVIVNTTLASNVADAASGLFDASTPVAGPRRISNTLIAGECEGVLLDSDGYNLESPGDTCGFDQDSDQPSVAEAQLNLGPLQNNGGPTETHALLANSAAIDQIPVSACVDGADEPVTTDQRDQPRPATEGSDCDIGAFEAQP